MSDDILLIMRVEELRIYKKAIEILPKVYELAGQLPKNEYALRSQLCNSAKAISAQIAEGFAKKQSQAEFKRFLFMALGSSDEAATHLRQILVLRFSNVDFSLCDFLIDEFNSESKQINTLIQKIRDQSIV